MKIVKQGKNPEDKVQRGQCRNCRTKIEAQKKELKFMNEDRGNGGNLYLECPVCNENIWFS